MELHSSNTYLGILDHNLQRVFKKRVISQLPLMLATLEPFRKELHGIAVESTYNWYWLVDGLMDASYRAIHLANPCAVKKYEGLKYAKNHHDAFWLAHLLALGILSEGYIYAKNDRPVRDLLRKRPFLVKQRTMLILSLKSLVERQTSLRLSRSEVKTLEP
jgi:hypothetical protein